MKIGHFSGNTVLRHDYEYIHKNKCKTFVFCKHFSGMGGVGDTYSNFGLEDQNFGFLRAGSVLKLDLALAGSDCKESRPIEF